jgi:hypothetical protein
VVGEQVSGARPAAHDDDGVVVAAKPATAVDVEALPL